MTDQRAGYRRMRLGWMLMSLPVGFRKPVGFLLRHGPYRWGARLHDSGMAAERRASRG